MSSLLSFKILVFGFCFVIWPTGYMAGNLNLSTVRQKTKNLAEVYLYYPDRQKVSDITKDDAVNDIDSTATVKILIHGWIANRDHVAMEPVKHAYLAKGQKNLLIVDWSKSAALFYPEARQQVYKVGMYLGEVLKTFFTTKNISLDNVHVIGHSLGAHVAGNIGKYFNGKIGRITALDPANPLVENGAYDSIKKTDAKFVDVIHSAIGTAGQKDPKGHVDFYPNRGVAVQPGCESLEIITLGSCSHYRAGSFFAESILNPTAFPAVKCSFGDIANGTRHCKMKAENDEDVVYMGENVSRKATGSYYLETFNLAPFGKGAYSFAA